MHLISVIVTTYNWPQAFKLCLLSLFAQDDAHFEIIIADDGSRAENVAKIRKLLKIAPVKVRLVHHEDSGFRAGTIRNKAVAKSKGDYLLFLDGDCVVFPDFIRKHRRLAEAGHFVPGNRILLSEPYTAHVIQNELLLQHKSFWDFAALRVQGKINRIAALLTLPLGKLRKIKPQKWQKAMTCNLAMWRKDFIHVNGFDELFEGWGFEDSDLVIRLIHAGVQRKEGRFALPVLHLWHPQNDRSKQESNMLRLIVRLENQQFIHAVQGVAKYLS